MSTGAVSDRVRRLPDARPASLVPTSVWILASVFALREAKALLVPVVMAVVLTFVLAPLVRRLYRAGLPTLAGSALVVLALVGSTLPLAAALTSPALAWLEKAPATAAQVLAHIDRIRASVPGFAAPTTPKLGSRSVPPPTPPVDPVKARIASEGVALTGTLVSHGASILMGTAATLVLLYFLLASEQWIVLRVLEATPGRRRRALLLGGLRAAQRDIAQYLLTQGLINVAVGCLVSAALWLMEFPNPVLWGAMSTLLCFVPYLGPLAMIGLLLAAGFSSESQGVQMVQPALAFTLLHTIESNLITPYVLGRRLVLSRLSVILSVLFWAWLWGISGALIAVPLLIALRRGCQRVRSWRTLGRFLEGECRTPPSLRSLMARHRSTSLEGSRSMG